MSGISQSFFPFQSTLKRFLSLRHRKRQSGGGGLSLPGPAEKMHNSAFDIITHCHDKSASVRLQPPEVVQYHLNTAVGTAPAQEAPDNQCARHLAQTPYSADI